MKLFGCAVLFFFVYCVGMASGLAAPTKESLKCSEEFWSRCQERNGVKAVSDIDPACRETCMSQVPSGASFFCIKDIPECLQGNLRR
uniref:Uncharacterized protein n=1 Tax=Ditylenchus dipsaci TaxID=166011 RepID=A0A915DNM8_9BILA